MYNMFANCCRLSLFPIGPCRLKNRCPQYRTAALQEYEHTACRCLAVRVAFGFSKALIIFTSIRLRDWLTACASHLFKLSTRTPDSIFPCGVWS